MNTIGKFSSQQEKLYPRPFFYQILVLLLEISIVGSQPTNTFNPNNPNNNDQLQNGKFSAPVAIVIVVLVVALFFMGFFSIYLRQCTATTNNNNNTVRNALAIARRANTNALQAAAAAAAAAPGLESSVIETFPMFSYAEVKDHKIGKGALECAVCLNEFGDDETLRLIPKCDHVFHPECIDAWLESHVTCPVCRSDLTPQAGDEPYHLPAEFNQENPENNIASGRSDDVAVHVDFQQEVIKPEVNRIWSFKYLNRPPRTESVRREGRNMVGLQGKFRSHSTGHSLVQPAENLDRFTLILPHEIRKEMMNRALLNRTKSVAAVLPRNGSSTTRWYSTRFGNRSSKGGTGSGNSFRRIEQPDRWLTAPFFSRAISGKPTKVVAEKGEPSTTTILKLPSLTCLEPKTIDEMSLMHVEPVQPPS